MILPQGQSLIEATFGKQLTPDMEHLYAERAILCPKNKDCLEINAKVLNGLPGHLVTYQSIDSVKEDDPAQVANFPTEFLNSLHVSGLPPHQLSVKVGAVIILLRNLNTHEGICNGTRLIVRVLSDNLITGEVLAGRAAGKVVFIPRMDLIPTDSDLPFQFCRRQFPVLPAFALTINKAQGQTFKHVGLFLPDPVFNHGQLYVAFSRVTSANGIKVMVKDKEFEQGKLLSTEPERIFTRNIVFREVFNS